eukprot:Blabericola_migrator_1__8894@NODE_4701_length_1014_cov_84_440338_g569_i4_p1_GENE_NODE_4701_length_1014_cov_84_440338_g569_i4NODE_4701_length_1014_cov_84_440338_g569_i4_p1_ORF_typecomplete_len136_score18_21EFhand_8/PF13833_6/28EFhand_8/PF13833_6/0_0028EFhand_8/PF13833_6/0_46EFhand_7/PF13499_6/0_033EFhand_6/PF13405_6/0_77EFhand_6/PF13405_6/2_6e02EFhand_6/PF13405_6/1_9e03EFhand_6/PF13405_6/62EFhand_6/PF13405_6/1_1e03EAP30/PF04157_16/0_05_NODE_4701_length_1014_cov_84_440338_g569_i45981005
MRTRGTLLVCSEYLIQEKKVRQVILVFKSLSSGFITVQEVGIALRALDISISKDELMRFSAASERLHQRTGCVSEADFVKLASSKLATKRPEEFIRSAFQLFETNGCITFEDIQRKSIEVGETLTDEEIHEVRHM